MVEDSEFALSRPGLVRKMQGVLRKTCTSCTFLYITVRFPTVKGFDKAVQRLSIRVAGVQGE